LQEEKVPALAEGISEEMGKKGGDTSPSMEIDRSNLWRQDVDGIRLYVHGKLVKKSKQDMTMKLDLFGAVVQRGLTRYGD
jgi:hypothetical protein